MMASTLLPNMFVKLGLHMVVSSAGHAYDNASRRISKVLGVNISIADISCE